MLITRPEPDAASFAALCEGHGLTAIAAPIMTIISEARPIDLKGASALAFTSANGVRAFSDNSTARQMPVFAVGAATGEAARLAGFTDIHIAGGDVENLTALIEKDRGALAGDVLHIAGAQRAGDLVGALSRRGVSARRETLYEARAADALPQNALIAIRQTPPVDWAAFFSPRTARLFVALVEKAGLEDRLCHIRAACLSDAVAEAAKPAFWKSVAIADQRDGEGVISAIMGSGINRHA